MTEPYKPKLIEVALPLMTINAESVREKSIRHGHPSTLHLWWARRPLAAARAVLWASLVDDPSGHPEQFPTPSDQEAERDRLFSILERLVPWEASSDSKLLAEARAEIDKCFDGEPPPILDPFGGGGAIPLEAQRLGLKALSGDLNPVAVLIQRAMLEIPPCFADLSPVSPEVESRLATWTGVQGLAADVESYGAWMRDEAKRKIGHLYPDVEGPTGEMLTPIAWIWARTVESPDPSWHGHVPLVRSWILAKRTGKPVTWIEPVVERSTQTISYAIREGGAPPAGSVERSGAHCIATGSPIPFEYIREKSRQGKLGQTLIAVVADAGRTRIYLPPTHDQVAAAECVAPTGVIPGTIFDWPGRTNVVRYGMTEWEQLFTARQLTALALLTDLVREVRPHIESAALVAGLSRDGVRLSDGGRGAAAYADAVVTYLALGISRLSDMCNNLCRWESSRTQVRNLFGRQAIPMVWDFAENNVFNDAGGDFRTSLGSVVNAMRRLPARGSAEVSQRDAQARITEAGPCAISTDPPYYDNISYADLSDFFFVWLRRCLADVWPDECATLLTPKSEELIANQYRAGSKQAAMTHFEAGMASVFAAVASVQDPAVPATVFYAFKQTEENADGRSSTGWETFLQALLDAGLSVTATWPMRTELGNRILAADSNALASSIVLACRPRLPTAALETRGGFVAALRSELPDAVRLLQHENIAPVDLAQSAIGPGMRIFSRYGKVIEADGSEMKVRAALGLINEALGEVLSTEEAELDADTRFALTWFEQFGHSSGSFGDADVLARAKDTSVSGVVEAGIAVSRDGRLRLLERSELEADWSPLADDRATVWESAQHLIRRLAESESSASALLAQLGGVAERARQLAYLLYGVCERKGWTDEAIAYNGLITAWPELQRLAAPVGSGPDQRSLI